MPRKTRASLTASRRRTSFNEAAARCRGKHRRRRPALRLPLGFNEAAARCRGKRAEAVRGDRQGQGASMRPRPDAAENSRGRRLLGGRRAASMRPRPDAAENPYLDTGDHVVIVRFNEAAARCRGKRTPRWSTKRSSGCFNEAAARCRGKPAAWTGRGCSRRRFNEAAARCRGKPTFRRSAAGPAALLQ